MVCPPCVEKKRTGVSMLTVSQYGGISRYKCSLYSSYSGFSLDSLPGSFYESQSSGTGTCVRRYVHGTYMVLCTMYWVHPLS
jgi:hypothetical protein